MSQRRVVTLNDNKRRELAGLLIESQGVIVQREPIELSSGKLTNHYFDAKTAVLMPRGTKLVGELGLDTALQLGARSVGGLELGAIPIATLIARESEGSENPISAFFVRKTPKKHGLKKYIEGSEILSPVLIVDDVVTTGQSIMQAVDAVRKERCEIAGVLAIVDRGDMVDNGESENTLFFRKNGIEFYSIFTDNDFREYIDEQKRLLGISAEPYLRSA